MSSLFATSSLFAVSLMVGLALGRFSWRAIAISSAALAVLAAAVLQRHGFEIVPGIAIIVACLAIHQLAYLAGVWFIGHGDLVEKHAHRYPGQGPNEDIGREDQKHQRPPSATAR
jgi:hypothetical protein